MSGEVIDAEYVYGAPESQPQDKNAFGGGGENPISTKQAGFISSHVGKIGADPQQRAREMFGKPIESLFGWEVTKSHQVAKVTMNLFVRYTMSGFGRDA